MAPSIVWGIGVGLIIAVADAVTIILAGSVDPTQWPIDDIDTLVNIALYSLIGFKVGLTIWILLAYPSSKNLFIPVALNWPWLLAAVAFLVAPALFWWRLVRVRAKRAKLQHSEWNVD